jgi:Skp family chaperone for outer membrane proteins
MPILAAFTLFTTAAVMPASAQDAAKVGTANTGQIFSQIRETKDLQQKITELGKSLGQQEQQKRANLTALQEARNQFKPESDQYHDKNQELMRAAIEFQTWGQVNKADIDREKKQEMKFIFDKIEAAVGEVAKQRGLDIVVADQRGDIQNIDQITEDNLRILLNQRIVLYSSGKNDLTNDVIAYMDKNYKAPAPAADAAAPAPTTPAPAPGK